MHRQRCGGQLYESIEQSRTFRGWLEEASRKIAIFRHLEPDLIAALRSHIPSTAWISPECPAALRSTQAAASVVAYFDESAKD
eukprot:g52290.t1